MHARQFSGAFAFKESRTNGPAVRLLYRWRRPNNGLALSSDLPLTPTAQFDATCLRQINMLCADVHTMLRLPVVGVRGLRGGCNLAAALTLLDMASGVSRVLSNNPTGIHGSGPLFTSFFRDHFPWGEEPVGSADGFQAVTGAAAADMLYNSYRCPLAHRLGTVDEKQIGRLKIAKDALSEGKIRAIECAANRPTGEAPTIAQATEPNPRTILNVPMLYWGLRKAICTAVTSAAARQAAPRQILVQTGHVPAEVTNAVGSMTNIPGSPWGQHAPDEEDS